MTTPASEASSALDSRLLASVSRSFHLSLRFLPKPVRHPLGLAYLLARTSDTLADEASLPLGIRLETLQAFRAAIEQGIPLDLLKRFPELKVRRPSEQNLLQHSDSLIENLLRLPNNLQSEIQRVIATITEGQSRDLTRFGYASSTNPAALANASDLQAYTYSVAGCVGEFWTRICLIQLPNFSRAPLEQLLEHGRLFGQGLQLVNILRDLPEDLDSGRCYLPADELAQYDLSPASLRQSGSAAKPVIQHWLTLATRWLEHGRDYERLIRGFQMKFSVSLPRRLGQRTLDALKTHPPLETAFRVKVSKAEVLRSSMLSLIGAFRPSDSA